MKLLAKLGFVLLATLGLATQVNAADVSKKEGEDLFWKVMNSIENEQPGYFELFSPKAKIIYNMPPSYGMKSGDYTFNEYKRGMEEFWLHAENHSFSLTKPQVEVKDGKATVTTTLYERYTMQGYTLINEAEQKYVISKTDGKVKIVEFSNNVKEINDIEFYNKASKAISKRK